MKNNNSPWLTIEQASEYAQVSRRTVETWLRDGLRHSKLRRVIRIRREWIDDYLEAFSEESRADAIVQELAREMRR